MNISKEIKTILKTVKEFLKVDVIYANQDHMRPCNDYINVYLIDEKQLGFAENNISVDGKINTIRKQYDVQLSFDCIGTNPYELASKLSLMFELSSIHNKLIANGIAWHKSHSIKNTTTFLDSKYLSRLTFEADFYINKTLEEDITFIEKVNFNGINK